VRRFLWLVVGLGLLAFGIYLVIVLDGSLDFGWYAYTPGEEERALEGDVTVLSRTQVLGAGCAAAGLAVLAAELGFRAGRKGA
jgi:hypothetical protein